MSANKEFPDPDLLELWGSTVYYPSYDVDEVDDWFKRCMEDSPIHKTRFGLWEEWYEKWFSQFRNKSDE